MTAEIHIGNHEHRHRKAQVGIVVKDKMNKTRVVEVARLVSHPLFRKVIRRRGRFKAHDEKNQTKIGDKVRLVECRPLSKDKRWRIVEVLKH